MDTSEFKDQHRELLFLVTKINNDLKDVTDLKEENASAISERLSELSGKVLHHLSMEDRYLYPNFLTHSDEAIAQKAQDFMNEMGGISDGFKSYLKKWTLGNIKDNPSGFSSESQALFQALQTRIEREEKELYPLIEAHK